MPIEVLNSCTASESESGPASGSVAENGLLSASSSDVSQPSRKVMIHYFERYGPAHAHLAPGLWARAIMSRAMASSFLATYWSLPLPVRAMLLRRVWFEWTTEDDADHYDPEWMGHVWPDCKLPAFQTECEFYGYSEPGEAAADENFGRCVIVDLGEIESDE